MTQRISRRGRGARAIAVLARGGAGPPVVWLGGFKSDMRSTKAYALDTWAAGGGRAFVRFDYSGHGESGGDFEAGTISQWLEDTLAVLAAFVPERPILVGSSMGGWLALLATRELLRRDPAAARRPRFDCAGDRFHRAADVGPVPGGRPPHDRDGGLYLAPVGLWRRALPDHPRADRGRPPASAPRRADRAPDARSTSFRACRTPTCPGARHAARRAPARRRRLPHPRQGRRPPPVAARRHRADDRGGRGHGDAASRSAAERSVQAHRLEVVRPGIGDGGVAESVRRIGAPLADRSANSLSPGWICGACGKSARTSSDRIGLT